ncbi:HugZ family protein [Pseudoroseomonas globiformis]|uniref:HugZ family protein n=1 Tax=Teichococcus globiformis TaxID=2307229 RepID=A0ABV7G0W7_9PROT
MMDKTGAAWQARALLRRAGTATLATQRDGQPFASLVTPAAAPDLSPLLWLSSLSEHTRQLRNEPRCALLIQDEPTDSNPQTAPRVTVTGVAEPVEADHIPALKARWLALHPYAAAYANFADFTLWRIRIGGALLVGGFAAAHRLRPADLLPSPASVAAIAAAEPSILGHMNEEHEDVLENMAIALGRQRPGAWRMVAADVDGCDLMGPEARRCRIAFALPVVDAASMRDALVAAAEEARRLLEK